MINKIKKLTIVLLIVLTILKRPLVIASILNGINIWTNSTFPALFPFLMISDLIISTDLINYITDYIGIYFSKIFKMSKYSSYVFIMSLISGCPSNAKYIKDLLDKDLINKEEAVKILSMSLLYNPIYILALTTYLKFSDSVFIIVLNIFINLIIGLINRNYKVSYNNNKKLIPEEYNITESISKTIDTLLIVLGSLTTFIALSSLLPISHPLLKGILEITIGLTDIQFTEGYKYKLIFTGILLAFGGLSIHTQIKSILKDKNLDYSLFYKSRIIHLILFLLLLYLKTIPTT